MTRSDDKPGRSRGRRLSEGQDPAFYEGLGHAIKVLRTEHKMERKELAVAADISYAYLSDIETGRGRPSSAALVAIAQALGLAPHELLRAAEQRQAAATPLMAMRRPSDLPVAPSQRRSWFQAQAGEDLSVSSALSPSLPAAALDGPAQGPVRAELDQALDELGPRDLEMVLELVRRLHR